jgi:moderate conductance mechanosensitive channel
MLLYLLMPLSLSATEPSPMRGKSMPPTGVFRMGDLETTTVDLGGQQVLRIFSPTVWDRSNPGSQIPVEQRAQRIAGQLLQVVTPRPLCPQPYSIYGRDPLDNLIKNLIVGDRANTSAYERCLKQNHGRNSELIFNPNTLQVQAARLNNEVVVVVSDRSRPDGQKLLTVTQEDANIHGLSREAVAEQWAEQLQAFLRQELANQQQDTQRNNALRKFCLVLLGVALLEIGKEFLRRKYRYWSKQRTTESDWTLPEKPLAVSAPDRPSLRQFWYWLRSALKSNEEHWLHWGLWLLGWLQIFALIDGLTALLSSQSGVLERAVALQLLTIPYKVLLYLLAGRLLIALILWTTRLAIAHWVWLSQSQLQEYARRNRRSRSIQAALRSVVKAVVWSVVVVLILGTLGLQPGDILAGGALVGGVLALIFQNLLRDWVAGAFILTEDQFALGDVIRVNGVDGTVTAFNLRCTQLRNLTGAWITIPNGSLQQVVNLSHYWSKAELQIPLAVDSDLGQATTVILQTLERVCSLPAWRSKVLEPPALLGLERFNAATATLRFLIKTQPGEQAPLQRVLRQEILQDLRQAHIRLGGPQLQVQRVLSDDADPQQNPADWL